MINKCEHKDNYTVVDNSYLRDEKLSIDTKGLMTLILSLPDKWTFSKAGLAKIANVGITKLNKMLKELKDNGYLKLIRRKVNDPLNKNFTWDYEFNEKAYIEKPYIEKPSMAFQPIYKVKKDKVKNVLNKELLDYSYDYESLTKVKDEETKVSSYNKENDLKEILDSKINTIKDFNNKIINQDSYLLLLDYLDYKEYNFNQKENVKSFLNNFNLIPDLTIRELLTNFNLL